MTPHPTDTEHQNDVSDSVARFERSRFERRRWSRRLRTWRPLLLGVGGVVLVVFLAWVVLVSSWLGMRHLEVSGLHRVGTSDVTRAAAIAPGTPLARIDLSGVEARVEAIPGVASAAVHRSWPQGLVITVTERQPVAAVSTGGRWWLMDRTGFLFNPATSPDPGRPIVDLGPAAGAETRAQVAMVLGALPPDLATATARVTASTQDSIVLHLRDGSEVRWGSAADSTTKATVLRALLHLMASFYDVSVPAQPATRG